AVSHKTSLLDPLEIRDLHKLVRDTDKVFPDPGNSSLGLMTAFFEAYLNADYTDRGLLTKEWMKGNRVSRITRTPSGANAGGGNLTDRGEGFVHDLTSLVRDVATGVLARSMDVDIYNLHPAHAKRVEEIIAENKPPFSVFRDKFITMPGGLDYSRAIVVASVKEAPIGIEVIPAHVTEYLNKVLIETDHANPDPEIVDIACGRSSAPMPQRVTEEGKHDGEEKPQPSCAMEDEQATAETVEPDATEHHQDTQPLDAQSQVNSVDTKYQKLRAELHEARKNIPPKNPVDADKLLAASRGEFVEGISDLNDPKWVKGIETRDSVNQNQQETEQNDQKAEQNSPTVQRKEPETKQSEPVAQREPEKVCTTCGQSGGGNCPDCGAVMGDATYQKTFNEENQNEYQEKGLEEMEGPEHLHKENAGSNPHCDCSGEATAPVVTEIVWPSYFEPGRYENIPNDVYHAANGISSTMVKDARISLMYYQGCHVSKTIKKDRSKVLDMGSLVHTLVLQPEILAEEFSIEPVIPESALTTTETIRAVIDEHNATLPAQLSAGEIKAMLDEYNATLPTPVPLNGDKEKIGMAYMELPGDFKRITGDNQNFTLTAMKACIKEYNATLPAPLKTNGNRDALLEQLAIINPALVALEAQKPRPLKVSGTKAELIQVVKSIKPDAVFADELLDTWRENPGNKILVTRQQFATALAIQSALYEHPEAGRLLQNPARAVEVSYFGIDEDTGLEIRVRPDVELEFEGLRIGFDLKTISVRDVKEEALKSRLHREITQRDYHLSAGMYCNVADLDKFAWIFVNKDEGYHWVSVVWASESLLELGKLEYRQTIRAIANAMDTGEWPAPITEDYTDELNDYDLRRLEALRTQA
ncbi:PD-(D/E)XK nuclease-like domain-containing protein, partial [Escherichia coli]|uniref:PD-(D/E)XK nuclease-like domain-containing protein n=1 Tax=Escherichia coli TaxID=562 RepID=UPI000BE1CAB6